VVPLTIKMLHGFGTNEAAGAGDENSVELHAEE
jgi:hypothetical protein